MRTSVLFLVFTLTVAQLLPASPRAATLDPQAATATGRLPTQIRDRAQITQRPDRLTLPDTVVPDLKGTSEQASSSVLAKSHLQAGKISTVDSDRPAGTIVGQQPDAGSRVRPGTAVDLFVSNGKTPSNATRGDRVSRIDQLVAAGIRAGAGLATTDTVVPDLRSVPPRTWSSVLERRGLQLGQIVEQDADQPKGTLLEQHPSAGTRVKRGTAVDAKVSNGIRSPGDDVSSEPSPQTPVRVPNVVGELIDPARLILGKYLLRLGDVKWIESRRPYGTVIDQDPQPEQVVKARSPVHVAVSQGPPRMVPAIVPAVVGQYLDTAVAQVRNATLQPGTTRIVPSRAAKGIVVGQSPVAGTRADRNSLVHLDVSAGEPLITVPNLVSGRLEAVGPTLERSRLQVGTLTREEDRVDAGIVIGQDPIAGSQVPPNTPVNIRVSLGDPWTVVPELQKADVGAAARLLENNNLRLGAIARKEARTNPGIVLEQSHPAGSRVRRGTPIGVVVSIEPELVTVPDLVHQTEENARAALAKTRLQIGGVSRQEGSIEAGLILMQEPPAGARVPPDTRVNLRLSLGEPPVIVPELVTLSLEDAIAAIRNANLQLGTVQRGEPRSRAGIVLTQSLQAGSQVRRAAGINLVVSTEEPVVPARSSTAESTPAAAPVAPSPPPSTPSPSGNPPPRVEGNTPVAPVDPSPPIPVDPSQWISQLPWSWIAGLGFVALYGVQRLRARGRKAPDVTKPDTPQIPKIELLSHLDRGWQDIAFDDEDEPVSALELAFIEDAGIQRVVEGLKHDTEQRHEYADTDAERSVRHKPRRAS